MFLSLKHKIIVTDGQENIQFRPIGSHCKLYILLNPRKVSTKWDQRV